MMCNWIRNLELSWYSGPFSRWQISIPGRGRQQVVIKLGSQEMPIVCFRAWDVAGGRLTRSIIIRLRARRFRMRGPERTPWENGSLPAGAS